MAYYDVHRGNKYLTTKGKEKFDTHSGMIIKADTVPAMLLQLATKHEEFLYRVDGAY